MTSMWHHHDPAQTPLWHHADLFWPCCVNSVATPILPCSPIRKSIYHRLWVESSVWWGPLWSTSQHPLPISAPLDLGLAVLDLWPLHLACELTAFLALWSYFDESHDHAFALRAVMEAPRCHVHNPEALWQYLHSYLCLCQATRWKKKMQFERFLTFWSFIISLSFAALKPEKGFSFTWISCCLWQRLELIEEQYKQSTHIQIYLHACGQPHFFSIFMKIMYSSTPPLSRSLSNTHMDKRIHKRTHKHTFIFC